MTRPDRADSAYEITSRIDGQPDPYLVTVDDGDPDQRPVLRPRAQRVVDAETGQALDQRLGEKLSAAASHLAFRREHVDRAHPSVRHHLAFLFGIGRNRADSGYSD